MEKRHNGKVRFDEWRFTAGASWRDSGQIARLAWALKTADEGERCSLIGWSALWLTHAWWWLLGVDHRRPNISHNMQWGAVIGTLGKEWASAGFSFLSFSLFSSFFIHLHFCKRETRETWFTGRKYHCFIFHSPETPPPYFPSGSATLRHETCDERPTCDTSSSFFLLIFFDFVRLGALPKEGFGSFAAAGITWYLAITWKREIFQPRTYWILKNGLPHV